LRQAGAPEESLAKNTDNHIEKAIRLIDDQTYRTQQKKLLQAIDFNSTLFEIEHGNRFANGIYDVYQHQTELKKSSQLEWA
jgi:predicted O-linked N-acetylglucosamine transferase (SPINDLY family)